MSFSFPLLSNAEILACLGELDVSLAEADLVKPQYETVRPMFETLVQLLMGLSRDELQQPVFAAIDGLEFPELHDESIGTLAFTRALGRLMAVSGVGDFSLKDVYKPEYARLRRQLSALVNFAKFREEKLAAYHELQEASEANLARRGQLEDQNRSLMAELAAIRAGREAEQPAVAALEAEAASLAATIGALNKQQAGLQAEVRALKTQGNELADQAANEKFELLNARQEEARLRSLIVQSPERLRAALAELEAAVGRERGGAAEAERRGRELAAKLAAIDKVEKDVQKCAKMMEEAEVEVNKYKGLSHTLKDLKASVAAQQAAAAAAAEQASLLKRQEQGVAERVARLEQQAGAKRRAAQAALEAARAAQAAAEADNEAAAAKAREADAAARAAEAGTAAARAAHARDVAELSTKYGALRKKVSEYHRAVLGAIQPNGSGGVAAGAPL